MSIVGTWDLRIRTPIGTIEVVYVFVETAGGVVTGTAASEREMVALQDVVVEGQRVRWRQAITRPLRLNLEFDVAIAGGELAGHSRAGRLPRSAVSGTRRADPSPVPRSLQDSQDR